MLNFGHSISWVNWRLREAPASLAAKNYCIHCLHIQIQSIWCVCRAAGEGSGDEKSVVSTESSSRACADVAHLLVWRCIISLLQHANQDEPSTLVASKFLDTKNSTAFTSFQHKPVKQSRLAFICSAYLCLDAQMVHTLKRLPTCKW